MEQTFQNFQNTKGVSFMKELKRMLDKEIEEELNYISTLKPGSEEHSEAIDSVAKLYKLRYEQDCKEKELEETTKHHEDEINIGCERDKQQLKEQKLDRYFKLGVEAAGVALPLIFYGAWINKGLKFEETGSFASTTFRGLLGKIKPTKK